MLIIVPDINKITSTRYFWFHLFNSRMQSTGYGPNHEKHKAQVEDNEENK
jgi:hypothetical protein